MHFPVPCTLRLIFNAVLQILQYMGQVSLMAASIMVECPVMVVDEDPHGNFPPESSLPLHIFSSVGKIHRILFRGGTDKDLGIFPIFPCKGTLCMHDRRLEEPLEQFFLSFLCLFRILPGEVVDYPVFDLIV